MATETIPPGEFKPLKELCEDYLDCIRLSVWEIQFMDDLAENLNEYGSKLRLSDKQWEVIERITAKVYAT
jgi:hypothetical protein